MVVPPCIAKLRSSAAVGSALSDSDVLSENEFGGQ